LGNQFTLGANVTVHISLHLRLQKNPAYDKLLVVLLACLLKLIIKNLLNLDNFFHEKSLDALKSYISRQNLVNFCPKKKNIDTTWLPIGGEKRTKYYN
jgi:hypothetical protein